MKFNFNNIILLFLFIPFLLEASGIKAFVIQIPGFPLSLGRGCLVLSAVFVSVQKLELFKLSIINIAFFLLIVGGLGGTFFSENLSDEILTFFGNGLLFFSVILFSKALDNKFILRVLNWFFVFTYCYWFYYIVTKTIVGGELQTFGATYREYGSEDASLLNYHSFGLIFGNSFLFLFFKYFFQKKKIDWRNFIFMVVSLVVLFITESRANFIITLIVLLLIIFYCMKLSFFGLLKNILLLSSFLFLIVIIIESDEVLSRRYSFFNDSNYLDQSIGARDDFVESTLTHLSEYPFGRGFSNNKIKYMTKNFQPHNQYATFLLSGGIISFFAIIIWLVEFSKKSYRILKLKLFSYYPYVSIIFATLVIMLTNDLSGAYFFLILIIQSWLFTKKLK
jgi:O-antigen ligase